MVTDVFFFLACLPVCLSVCLSACFLPAPPGLAVVCSHEEVQEGCEAGGGGTSFELADALAAGAEGGGGAEGAGGAEGGGGGEGGEEGVGAGGEEEAAEEEKKPAAPAPETK